MVKRHKKWYIHFTTASKSYNGSTHSALCKKNKSKKNTEIGGSARTGCQKKICVGIINRTSVVNSGKNQDDVVKIEI